METIKVLVKLVQFTNHSNVLDTVIMKGKTFTEALCKGDEFFAKKAESLHIVTDVIGEIIQ